MFTRHTIALSWLGLLLWGTALPAQSFFGADPVTGDVSGSVYNAAAPLAGLDGGYFWFQGDFGERPGAPGNVFSTGVLAPIQMYGPNQALVVDGQVWVLENREIGGNIGLNNRWIINEWGSMLGLNAFLTWDHTQNGNFMRQFSVGGEWKTEMLEFTGNFYLPWNDDPKTYGPLILSDMCMPQGNGFIFLDQIRAEQQMIGGDIEGGLAIPRLEWVSVYGGAYWWDASLGESVRGVSGRVNMDLNSVQVGAQIFNDNVFGTSFNANATLLLGAGPITITPRRKDLYARLTDRTRRQNRTAVQQTLLDVETPVINPNTGLPYNIVVVDNTNAVAGTGTFENPYNNLSFASGSTADIIFVRRGTTTLATPLAGGTGLVLNDNQWVIGEGTPISLPAANRPGHFCVLSTAGTNPFVTADPGNSIITLADNNRIIGLNMISPVGGNMISGTGIDSFLIQNINQNVGAATTGPGAGIFLQNASGIGEINNFVFNNPAPVAPGGIVIRNVGAPVLDLTVTNANIIGGMSGIELRGNNSEINAVLNNVQNSGSGFGLQLRASNNGNVDAMVTNSSFTGATNDAVRILSETGGNVLLTGTNLNLSGAGQDGLNSVLNNGTATVTLTDTMLDGAGGDGIDAQLSNSGILNLALLNSSAIGVGGNALAFDLSLGSQANVEVTGGDYSGAGVNSVIARLANASQLAFTADNVNLNNAGNAGLIALANSGSQVDLTLLNSTLDQAGASEGIRVRLLNGSMGTLQLENSSAEMAATDGLRIEVLSGSQFTANLENSSFDGAGQEGVDLFVQNSNLAFLLDNVSVDNVTDHGLRLITGNSNVNGQLTNGTSFNNAGESALQIIGLSGSNVVLNAHGLSGANAGNHGIHLATANGSTVTFASTATGSFTSPGLSGLLLTAENGSVLNVDISGVGGSGLFNQANHFGVQAGIKDSTLNLNLNQLAFGSAGATGMNLNAVNSVISANLTNLNFVGAGADGMVWDLDNTVTAGPVNLQNITVATSGGRGLAVNATNGSNASFNLNNFNANNSASDAYQFFSNNSTLTVVGSNDIRGGNSGGHALHLQATNGGTTNVTLGDQLVFGFAAGDAIRYIANNGTINLNVNGNPGSFFRAGGHAVNGNLSNGSTANINLTNLNAVNANLNGFNIISVDSVFTANINNSNFSRTLPGLTDNGINAILVNNPLSTLNALNSNFDNMLVDGLHAEAYVNTLFNVTVTGSSFLFAGDQQQDVFADGTSTVNVIP